MELNKIDDEMIYVYKTNKVFNLFISKKRKESEYEIRKNGLSEFI